MLNQLISFFKPKESYRTLLMFGSVNDSAAAEITVNGTIIHSGPLASGLLFKFVTNVKVHGTVDVNIKLIYGSFTINNIRARYPALINNSYRGYIDFPQPISQPIINHVFPLVVSDTISYKHFMYNGPKQWLTNSKSNQRVVVIEDYYTAAKTGIIKTDWQYYHKTINIDELDNINLH